MSDISIFFCFMQIKYVSRINKYEACFLNSTKLLKSGFAKFKRFVRFGRGAMGLDKVVLWCQNTDLPWAYPKRPAYPWYPSWLLLGGEAKVRLHLLCFISVISHCCESTGWEILKIAFVSAESPMRLQDRWAALLCIQHAASLLPCYLTWNGF